MRSCGRSRYLYSESGKSRDSPPENPGTLSLSLRPRRSSLVVCPRLLFLVCRRLGVVIIHSLVRDDCVRSVHAVGG